MKKKLDLLTPIGIILGLTVVLLAIFSVGGSIMNYIQLASILIVFGGVFAALLVSFSWQDLKTLPRIVRETFQLSTYDLKELINTFVDLSTKARREGLLALEVGIEEVDNPFIKKGILLAVDGIEPDIIKDIMMAEVIAMEERHRKGRVIFEKAGEYAPSWGMVGTLVSLVIMLNNLNDPSSIGPSMALALITTLYGSLLANLFFIPMANKLELKTEEEVFVKQMIIEGIIGVQSGQNPRILEEKLSAFLPADVRDQVIEEQEEAISNE